LFVPAYLTGTIHSNELKIKKFSAVGCGYFATAVTRESTADVADLPQSAATGAT
jgi:hypothetical protein